MPTVTFATISGPASGATVVVVVVVVVVMVVSVVAGTGTVVVGRGGVVVVDIGTTVVVNTVDVVAPASGATVLAVFSAVEAQDARTRTNATTRTVIGRTEVSMC
jgi:hypothetical protein